MPIPLTCTCGRTLRVKDEFAGRKVRCPACQDVLAVPKPAAVEEEAGELLLAEEADDAPAAETKPNRFDATTRPPRRPRADDEEGETGIQARPYRPDPMAYRPPPAPEPKRSRRPRRAEPRGPRVAFEEGWLGSLNAGIIGGLLMMLIAVVWFVGGLAVGFIFFYPPVLLVIGFIAFIKGLTDRG